MSEAAGTEAKAITCSRNTCREIFTKTVCGTAQKSFKYIRYIDLPRVCVPNQIMGCSVIGLRLQKPEVEESGTGVNSLRAKGHCQIHMWYIREHGKETSVLQYPFNFDELLPLDNFNCPNTGNLEVRIITGKKPLVSASAMIENDRIKLDIELRICAELISETKLCVKVVPRP
ncbi:outer spore coat protein CotE [Desulfallas thermosapovorans]|uniref:Spore coat protein E n=1 Tax=Desulfallas thermosapovorans DSM 6562 TaxID=1121431 RepID=A0A5S4ZPW5_9FIRM|nr:outer spore coat protein CotE [Desulfallas thermosapovorans]TYO94713.1 spore coat protein E [Desulfallas thermosapovorans DSM 6562]